MRAQYHSRKAGRGLLVWDVHRLVRLAKDLPEERLLLTCVRELDENYWDDGELRMSCRQVVDHARLMAEADLSFPVILSSDGRVMDGMHRIGRALLEGRDWVAAVRFVRDPEPDYMDVDPETLPYVDSE